MSLSLSPISSSFSCSCLTVILRLLPTAAVSNGTSEQASPVLQRQTIPAVSIPLRKAAASSANSAVSRSVLSISVFIGLHFHLSFSPFLFRSFLLSSPLPPCSPFSPFLLPDGRQLVRRAVLLAERRFSVKFFLIFFPSHTLVAFKVQLSQFFRIADHQCVFIYQKWAADFFSYSQTTQIPILANMSSANSLLQ